MAPVLFSTVILSIYMYVSMCKRTDVLVSFEQGRCLCDHSLELQYFFFALSDSLTLFF